MIIQSFNNNLLLGILFLGLGCQADNSFFSKKSSHNVSFKRSFKKLIDNESKFFGRLPKGDILKNLPNTLFCFAQEQDDIIRYCKQVSINVNPAVLEKYAVYLELIKKNGKDAEKDFYKNMTLKDFIFRLLSQRPFAYYGPDGNTLFRDGTMMHLDQDNSGDLVQYNQKIYSLKDYLSPQERLLSSYLSVASGTFFINNGNRYNMAKKGSESSYQKSGVIIGVVGPQIERINDMFTQALLVTKQQNSRDNGYGYDANSAILTRSLFNQDYLPTYNEINNAFQKNDTKITPRDEIIRARYQALKVGSQVKVSRYLKITNSEIVYFDIESYKNYLRMVIEPYLREANVRAKNEDKKAFCHVVAIGLGVWKLFDQQEQYMLEVYKDILNNVDLPHIEEIHFGAFSNAFSNVWDSFKSTKGSNKDIKYSSSVHCPPNQYSRDPSKKLNKSDILLVEMYAWDGFAYPGNEYWNNMLAASGDPAAIASSNAGSIHNPLINPFFKKAASRLAKLLCKS